MRVAAVIVGVFGAIAGFVGALVAMFVGGVATALEVEGGETVTILGAVALGMSVVGLVGAALAMAKPRVAAVLMLASAVVGVIAVSAAYAVAAVLLLSGAILAFLDRSRGQIQSTSQKPVHPPKAQPGR